MSTGRGRDGDPETDELRELLLDADEAIVVPPGLWERVRVPRIASVWSARRRRWVLVAAAAALLVVMVAGFAAGVQWQRNQDSSSPATAGSLTVTLDRAGEGGPSAGGVCGVGSSSNSNVTTCVSINGSGLKVDSAVAEATVRNAARTLQVCLRGPAGEIGCSQFQSVPAGNTLSLQWSPHGDVPPGQYCATTMRLGVDGSQTEIGAYCAQLRG